MRIVGRRICAALDEGDEDIGDKAFTLMPATVIACKLAGASVPEMIDFLEDCVRIYEKSKRETIM